jgi:hypothetical protein
MPISITQLQAYAYIYCDVLECAAYFIYSSFAIRISMHKSTLNRKEFMYISIGWLYDLPDLNAIARVLACM